MSELQNEYDEYCTHVDEVEVVDVPKEVNISFDKIFNKWRYIGAQLEGELK